MSLVEAMGWALPASVVMGCCASALACAMLVRQAVGVTRARSEATATLAGVRDQRLFDAVLDARRDPGDRVALERLVLMVRESLAGMPERRRGWVLWCLDRDSSAERRRYVMAVTGKVAPPPTSPVPMHPRSTAA